MELKEKQIQEQNSTARFVSTVICIIHVLSKKPQNTPLLSYPAIQQSLIKHSHCLLKYLNWIYFKQEMR